MRDAILRILAPVRRRTQWQFALRALSLGVVLGGISSVVLIVAPAGWESRRFPGQP